MLTREVANTFQAEWQMSNDMGSSSIRQFEAMIRCAILLTKTQVQLASAGKGHWDFSGIAERVLSTPAGQNVGDGAYDAAYLRAIQAMWASYTIWLATPIKVVVNGQEVTLPQRPLDLIMSTPVLAQAKTQNEEGA